MRYEAVEYHVAGCRLPVFKVPEPRHPTAAVKQLRQSVEVIESVNVKIRFTPEFPDECHEFGGRVLGLECEKANGGEQFIRAAWTDGLRHPVERATVMIA